MLPNRGWKNKIVWFLFAKWLLASIIVIRYVKFLLEHFKGTNVVMEARAFVVSVKYTKDATFQTYFLNQTFLWWQKMLILSRKNKSCFFFCFFLPFFFHVIHCVCHTLCALIFISFVLLIDTATPTDKSDFKKELDLYMSLEPHPNVVSMLGCCTERGRYYQFRLGLDFTKS